MGGAIGAITGSVAGAARLEVQMFDPTAKCVHVAPSSSMQQCIDTYGIKGRGEWVNNSISRNAQFWSCGMISRRPSTPKHDHDPEELAHCHRLANEAANVIGAWWPLLRSSSDPVTQPFYIAAQRRAAAPKKIDEPVLRALLGGTLHPDAAVEIEPFAEGTKWWQKIEEDAKSRAAEPGEGTFDEIVAQWRDLMKWFSTSRLSRASFTRTTHSVKPCHTLGCVFPCFVVGISNKGSLIGISTHVVS
jgi:hypothetical protein